MFLPPAQPYRSSEIHNCWVIFSIWDVFWSIKLLTCLLLTGIAINLQFNKQNWQQLCLFNLLLPQTFVSNYSLHNGTGLYLAIIQFNSWNPLQLEANTGSDSLHRILKRGFPAEVKHQWTRPTKKKKKISQENSKEGSQRSSRDAKWLENKSNGFYFNGTCMNWAGFVILKLKPEDTPKFEPLLWNPAEPTQGCFHQSAVVL